MGIPTTSRCALRSVAGVALAWGVVLAAACSSVLETDSSGNEGQPDGGTTPGADPELRVATQGSGRVSSDPAGVDCGDRCQVRFPAGTAVSLAATADEGFDFIGWTGGCTGIGECVVALDQDVAVGALFAQRETIAIPVAGSSDDALQNPDGAVVVAHAWMSMYSLDHVGGLRFQLPIGRGALVTGAYLEVYVDSVNEDDPNLRIHGQLAGDAPAFSEAAGDLAGRPLTAASTVWNQINLGQGYRRTPSLVSTIQEVVDQPAWSAGNHLVLVARQITDTDFEFRQWDHSQGEFAAKLTIEYADP